MKSIYEKSQWRNTDGRVVLSDFEESRTDQSYVIGLKEKVRNQIIKGNIGHLDNVPDSVSDSGLKKGISLAMKQDSTAFDNYYGSELPDIYQELHKRQESVEARARERTRKEQELKDFVESARKANKVISESN